MADGKITFSVTTEMKEFQKDLKKMESEWKDFRLRTLGLEEKIKKADERRERSIFGGKLKREAQKATEDAERATQKQGKIVKDYTFYLNSFTDAQKKLIKKHAPHADKMTEGSLSSKLKKQGLTIEDFHNFLDTQEKLNLAQAEYNKLQARSTELRYKFNAKSEQLSATARTKDEQKDVDTLAEYQAKLSDIAANYDAVKAKLTEAQAEQERLATEADEATDSVEEEREKVSLIQVILEKIKALGKVVLRIFKRLLKLTARALFTPFRKFGERLKRTNKALVSFKKRLKNAIIQGILLRPLREAFYGIYEAVSSATKQNILFRDSMANLKGTLWTAFVPVFEAVIPLLAKGMNYLANMITYVSALTNALFRLKPASKKAAEELANTADPKKDEKNFASWDTVQQLKKKSEKIEPTFEQDFEKAEDSMEEIKKAVLRDDWFNVGEIISEKLNGIMLTLSSWLNLHLLPFLNKFSERLGNFLNGMVSKLNFDKLGYVFSNGLNAIIQAFLKFFRTFDGYNFGLRLASSVNSLVNNIRWDNIGRVISEGLNDIIGFFAGFFTKFDGLNFGHKLAQSINNVFENLNVGQLARAISEFIKDILQTFIGVVEKTNWRLIGERIGELIAKIDWKGIVHLIFEAIGAAFGGLLEFLIGLVKRPWQQFQQWWKKIVEDSGGDIGTALANGLFYGIMAVIEGVYNFVKEHVFNPIINGIKKVFGIASPARTMIPIGEFIVKGILEGIAKGTFNLGRTIKNLLFDPIMGAVNNSFDNSVIDKMWWFGWHMTEAIYNGINWGYKFIKEIIGDISNFLSRSFSNLSSKVSNFGRNTGGSNSWGSSYGTFSTYSAPGLAQGSVVNPGHKFAAILGDNRQEQEIVSPLSTMKEALLEALQESSPRGSGNITLQIDGATFARITNPYLQREQNRVGVKATGGLIR